MTRWNEFVRSVAQIEWGDACTALAIFVVFLLFRKIFTKYIFKMIVAMSKKTPTKVFTNVLFAFERPLHIFWIVLGTYMALMYLPFNITTIEFVKHMYRSIIIMLIGWGLYNYTSVRSMTFNHLTRNFDIDENNMLLPFLSKILRFTVVALMIVVIASEWGYSISGFVAGLGLGGLAFALAAQETLANFFGGIVIITEKPFAKGDWIETPTVEGTVEDITFRSSKIRTFANAVVTVPNSTLSKEPITNWTKMKKRRITFSLGVAYGTPKKKLDSCVRRIETLLRTNNDIHQELIMVRFNEFSHSGMDIYLYFFTKTTVWTEWFRVKEEINFAILQILEDEGVSVALPARDLYIRDRHYIEDIENRAQNEK
ncbi:mechanosensitive ion channel family protein [bacterium LRH843]|nr:mechanosensitive ion channel family protein [bacterium LRH843]